MTTPTSLMALSVHDGIEEWLAAAVTDGLSAEERKVFDDHLAGCARCRELFAEETAMSQTIQNAFQTVRPLPGFERRLTDAFRKRHEAGLAERLRVYVDGVFRTPAARVLSATACVLVLVALGGGLTHELPSGERMFPSPNPSAVFSVDAALPARVVKDAPGNKEPGPSTGSLSYAPSMSRLSQRRLDAVSRSPSPASPVAAAPAAGEAATAARASASMKNATVNRSVAARDSGSFGLKAGAASSKTPLLGDVPLVGRLFSNDKDSTKKMSSLGSAPTGTLDAVGGMLKAAEAQGAVSATAAAAAIPGLPTDAAASLAAAPPPPQPEPSNPPAAGTPDNRKLIRNANVELEVPSFDPAVDALGAAASQVGGGYVATVDSSRLPNGKRRGTIVIKVLPDRLDAFLGRLKELGDVKSQNISTQDVTKEYFDTDARLRNARRMEDRLLKILDEDKGKLTEILQVEKELGRVREDIEKMQGELQLYDALVRFATVTIDLYERDLKQPATFLLHQTADLSLLCTDVEKTYNEARHAADDAHAQIENSELVRADDGHVTAVLRLLLVPETADTVIARLRALARVENFKLTGERVAENGDAANAGSDADAAKLKRGPVTLNLSIAHDEETHRRVTLTVTAADTSPAFDKARAAGLAAGAEIVSADFTRTQGVHGSGVLVLRLPAKQEASLLETVRSLGHTSDLNVQRDNNIAPDADTAPILLTLNFADENIARSVSLTLIAHDLDAAFNKIRAAALAAGAEITTSSLVRTQDAEGHGQLGFRLPAASEAGVLGTVRSLGRTLDYTVQRDPSALADEPENGPIALTINIADQEAPVQQTDLAVLCDQVSKRQADVRKIAADAGAQVRSSSFDQSTDGGEQASLVVDLPLSAYDGFLARVKSLGNVTNLNVHRQDHPEATASGAPNTAPAEVSLRLYSRGPVVSDESGLGATLRHTLGQGAGALMWSLRMIGVALAFLAPWVLAAVLVIWLARFAARRKERQSRKTQEGQRPS